MNIFTILSLSLFVFLALKVKDIVLDLEGDSDSLREFRYAHFILKRSIDSSADESTRKSREHSGFMGCHLQILVLVGKSSIELISIVPEDIPALPKMELGHFFSVYFGETQFLHIRIFGTLQQYMERSKIHHISCIHTDVNTIN